MIRRNFTPISVAISKRSEIRSAAQDFWCVGLIVSVCTVALLSFSGVALAQQFKITRLIEHTPVIDSFTSRTNSDSAEYPPLQEDTDLLQWYRDGVNFGNSTADLKAEEPPIENSQFGVVATYVGQGNFNQFASNGPSFNVAEFEAQIHEHMDHKAIGYSYAINFNKNLYTADGWGLARNSNDSSSWHTGYRRMNIASISKTLTAVGVLQLLEKNGLSIYDPVGPWLPEDWPKGPGFSNPQSISFYDLLTHHSGLKQTLLAVEAHDADFKALDKVKWDGLKAMVEWGTHPGYHEVPDPVYSNVNFALFRVIIPALWKASGENPGIGELNETEAAALYENYMAENLFIPLEIHQASCHQLFEDDPIFYYNFYASNGAGAEPTNWTLSCGSGGWYLSAHNLANVMANIRYNDNILSPAMRSLMDQHKLGWSYSWSINGNHGLYRAHAGAWYRDNSDFGQRREMQGCVMKFPIHVEAVLLVNSSIEDNILPCTKLAAAFDAAWVD